MNLTQRLASRRGFLRGMLGATAFNVALPFLDCFLNANGTALADGAPLPTRLFWRFTRTAPGPLRTLFGVRCKSGASMHEEAFACLGQNSRALFNELLRHRSHWSRSVGVRLFS